MTEFSNAKCEKKIAKDDEKLICYIYKNFKKVGKYRINEGDGSKRRWQIHLASTL